MISIKAIAKMLVVVASLLIACVVCLPRSHAAEGLLWGDADLAEWQLRTQRGPFKSAGDAFDPIIPGEWERIVSEKNSFLKNPQKDRKSSIVMDGGPTSGEGIILNHIELLSAAFFSLVKEDSSVKRAVVDELVWHSKQNGLQISPTRYIETDYGNWWQVSWLSRLTMAADFVKDEFSRGERDSVESWLGDWARAYERSVHTELSKYRFTNRYNRDYTQGGTYFKTPSFKRYAYMDVKGVKANPVDRMGRSYNNRRSSIMQFVGLYSIWVDDKVLIDRSKLYFEEWLKFSVFPDGSACEYHRNEDRGRNIQTGFIYNTINLEAYVTIADALARKGDISLYELSTRDGIHGTEVPAGKPSKTLKRVAYTHFDLIEGKKKWYNAGGIISEDYRIDNVVNKVGSAPEGRQWVNEIWFAPLANRYLDDDRLKLGYTRSASGSIPYNKNLGSAGPFGPPWRGHGAIFPSVLFMFGEMEYLSVTYPTRGGEAQPPAGGGASLPAEPASETVVETPASGFPLGYREAKVNGLKVFGLDPAWSDGRSFEKVFDGDTATFYDYGLSGESFVGVDFGEARRAVSIRFHPRSGFALRMVGGLFQGSNESPTLGYETIYEVTAQPPENMQTFQVNTGKAYRYYRFYSPDRSHGNIAEFTVELLSSDLKDTDRLPDAWEENYFGGIFAVNGGESDDFDQDGSDNFEEWLAGTDPTDNADFITIKRRHGVTWMGVKGQSYAIEFSDDNWQTKSTAAEVVGGGSRIDWVDPTDGGAGVTRSYRVIPLSK